MFIFRIWKRNMILKLNKSLKCIKLLVCDICIVIKNIFAQVVTRMKVSISKFVSQVISIPNQLIKDRVVGLKLVKKSVDSNLVTASIQDEIINNRNITTEKINIKGVECLNMDDVNEEEVKIEEDEIKIEIREEVENNSERISNLCPAVCKTSKFLLRHKMEVMYFLIPKFA